MLLVPPWGMCIISDVVPAFQPEITFTYDAQVVVDAVYFRCSEPSYHAWFARAK